MSQFRLHPEPGAHDNAEFRIDKYAYRTIKNGSVGSLLVVPHILMPIYGIYVLLTKYSQWAAQTEDFLGIVVGLAEGLSLGAAIGLGILRYGSSGKITKGRRIEKTASEDEARKQARIEVALRSAVYIFFAALAWEYLNQSKLSPMSSDFSRRQSSGILTANSHLRKLFSKENVLPNAEETRRQISGVGLKFDLEDRLRNAPRVHIPGTDRFPFQDQMDKIWAKLPPFRLGAFDLGPPNY